MLKLDRLAKTFDDGTQAVRGIDLIVQAGDFVVLLGPSGCGKTTTLRMVAGLETPTSGNIWLNDTNVSASPASQRDVGFVFQFYALYPHMTVRQNVAFPLENQAISPSERDARVARIADQLGITPLLDRHSSQLSGGDQQRVSLGRAMVREPAIYLMDEPLGQLDVNIRLDLRESIRRQQMETGVTTLYVTHDQEEALSLADQVVVMNGGLIEQVGSPEDVYATPSSLFVADFVGRPGMNLVNGTLGDDAVFRTHDTTFSFPATMHRGDATLGIRPEFVGFSDSGQIEGEISISEYFGDHHVAHVNTNLGSIAVRTDMAQTTGSRVTLDLNLDHACLYDPSTGRIVT